VALSQRTISALCSQGGRRETLLNGVQRSLKELDNFLGDRPFFAGNTVLLVNGT
jgi:hypothetical protein